MMDDICGEWFISDTRYGPMVHARLGIAAQNSGKLVSHIREQARELAENRGIEKILIDGPPGIGCPVIASVNGCDLAMVITEPTLSGLHDLERVAQLTRHFNIKTITCINKWDLNEELTEKIESRAAELGIESVGRIRFDAEVTKAQIEARAVVEKNESPAAKDVRKIWHNVKPELIKKE
jgi:MinD superfamily P-loop ATPase